MSIQKVISRPSPASFSRGRKDMPALSRRVHYQASEVGRDGVQVVDAQGNALDKEEAIERLGGDNAPYIELVSDSSRLQTEALCARHPEQHPDEVMARHYAAQARHLDPSDRAVVAVHREPDGSYHAHLLLPGTEAEYGRLEGPRGAAQKAYDQAWMEGKAFHPVRDKAAKEAADRSEEQARALRKEANRVAREGRSEHPDAEVRHRVRMENVAKREDIEARLHAQNLETLALRYRARRQEGSLEHRVEVEREERRHKAQTNLVERLRTGFARERDARNDREAFKHLNAAQRLVLRQEALEREMAVVLERQIQDLKGATEHTRQELLSRHKAETEAILLRHQIARQKDQEQDFAKGTKNIDVVQAAERQAMERRALQLEAEGRGQDRPTEASIRRLEARHERETLALEARKAASLKSPRERVAWREGVLLRQQDAVRAHAQIELDVLGDDPRSAAKRLEIENRRDRTLEVLAAQNEVARIREREREVGSSDSLLGRVADKNLRRFALGRATLVASRGSLMAERHRLEEKVLHLQAQAYGRPRADASDLQKLHTRQAAERAALAGGGAKDAARTVTKPAKKVAKKVLTMAPRAALKALDKALKAGQKQPRNKAVRDLNQVGDIAQGGALSAAQGVAQVGVTAVQEAAKIAIHQARHAAQAIGEIGKGVAAGIATGNPLAGVKVASEGLGRVAGESAKDLAQDAAKGTKAVSRDAVQAAKQSTEQVLQGLTSFGMNAAPQEVQALTKAGKELAQGAAKTVKSAVSMDLVGTVTNAAGTAIGTAKELTGIVRGKLPLPLDKAFDLAAKLPIVGIAARVAKLGAELSVGAQAAAKTLDLDR